MKKTLLIISALLFITVVSLAAVIHIPQDYSTIQEGLYAASAGDSIIIAPGVFYGFTWDGDTKPNITVLGAGAFGTSITKLQGNVTCDGIFLVDCTGWELGQMEITNFYSGVVLEHCDDIEVHHIYSHNNPYGYAYGIHLEFNANTYVHHNVLAYNSYVAIRVNDGNTDTRIINNTIVHTNQYHGIMVMNYQPGYHLQITNNIIAFNSQSGVKFVPSNSQADAILTYNDNYSNGSNWYGCTPGIGNISLEPLFQGVQPYLYGLTLNSPCIDAGDPQSQYDPDNTRADIGALYFNQAPPQVDDLVIQVIDGQVHLTWSQLAGVRTYNVYRSTQPYFSISGLTPYAVVSTSQFTDSVALTQNYYYIVTGYVTD